MGKENKEVVKYNILNLIHEQNWTQVKVIVSELSPEDISEILETLEKEYWGIFFRLLPNSLSMSVFRYVEPYVAQEILKGLTEENIKKIINDMLPDERTALLEELPGVVTRKILKFLPKASHHETLKLLGYPENSIGRMMTTNYLYVYKDSNVGDVIEQIKKKAKNKELVSLIFVINEKKKLQGLIRLQKIISFDGKILISDLIEESPSLRAYDDREEAINIFQNYYMEALPVTDKNHILIGIVTFDDLFEAAEEEIKEDIYLSSGVKPFEFRYNHVSYSFLFKKRIGWLLFLFITAFISSSIIAYFGKMLESNIMLSYFIPVLIGAGGNTGSQGATIIIRALATKEISFQTWKTTLFKEIRVGLLLSATLGPLMFGFSYLYTHDIRLSLTAGTSMIFLVLWANFVGSMLPILLYKFNIDPAVVSNPFLTTLIDATGISIYFITAQFLIV